MRPAWYPDWTGETCVIVGGGPSAAQADLSVVRGRARVVVINTSFKLAPWADVLYACDDAFWRTYHDEALAFSGLKITQDAVAVARFTDRTQGALKRVVSEEVDWLVDRPGYIGWGGNSGFQAINIVVQFGVKKIVLVGFDLRIDRGLHWHGKHPRSMNNPIETNVARWRRAIDGLAPVLRSRDIEVVNTSTVSKLENYPKVSLQDALNAGQFPVRKEPQVKRIIAIAGEPVGPHRIFAFHDQFSFYLQTEMAKRGIEILRYDRQPNPEGLFETIPVEDVDHIIGFGNKYFDKFFKADQLAKIKKRLRGKTVQFADGPRHESIADLSLTCKSAASRNAPHCVIGWAADPEVCVSKQERGGPLCILIDHPAYDDKSLRIDLTASFARQAETLKSSPLPARFGYNGVEIDMLSSPKGGAPFVPFTEIAQRYSRAHIFLHGHPESVGLCAIEAAMAGCLVVTHKEFIPDELLTTIRRIAIDDKNVPWAKILSKIDPAASRAKAITQSWSLVCDKLLAGLR